MKTYIEIEASSAGEALKLAKAQLKDDVLDIDGQNGRMDFRAWETTYVYDDASFCPEGKGVRVTDVCRFDELEAVDYLQDDDGL